MYRGDKVRVLDVFHHHFLSDYFPEEALATHQGVFLQRGLMLPPQWVGMWVGLHQWAGQLVQCSLAHQYSQAVRQIKE